MTKAQQIHEETTILLIDDEPRNLRMMVKFLEGEGFEVLIARDGKSGYQRAIYARPDLILLDAILPDTNGFEICRQLKTNLETAQIPVLFLTVLTVPADWQRAISSGAADYITKPVQWEELLLRIRTQIRILHLERELAEVKAQLARMNG
ncbi:MAG: response regulator [Chloroflexota bacterium]